MFHTIDVLIQVSLNWMLSQMVLLQELKWTSNDLDVLELPKMQKKLYVFVYVKIVYMSCLLLSI